jgi:hypothetical protein
MTEIKFRFKFWWKPTLLLQLVDLEWMRTAPLMDEKTFFWVKKVFTSAIQYFKFWVSDSKLLRFFSSMNDKAQGSSTQTLLGFFNSWVLEHLQRCWVCDPEKIFFTSKFSYVLFCNPTNKTETGRANRWGTTNNKPPGPIIMMSQSETLSSS